MANGVLGGIFGAFGQAVLTHDQDGAFGDGSTFKPTPADQADTRPVAEFSARIVTVYSPTDNGAATVAVDTDPEATALPLRVIVDDPLVSVNTARTQFAAVVGHA